MFKILNLRNIKLGWLRFIILFIFGIPVLTGYPIGIMIKSIKEILHTTPEITSLFIWTLYACFLLSIVFLSTGGKKLLEYLSMAFIMGLTTVITGAILRKLLPFLAGGLSEDKISYDLIMKLIITIMILPYSIFTINSFSVKNIIEKLSKMDGKFKTIGMHFALAFRVAQHAGEVIFNLLEIWYEEHPQKLIPRYHREWGIEWYSFANIFPWIYEAITAWVFACMIQTLEPIPAMVEEVHKFNKIISKGD